MLGYNSADKYWDIPFPDFTFYGHEHSWLNGASTVHGAKESKPSTPHLEQCSRYWDIPLPDATFQLGFSRPGGSRWSLLVVRPAANTWSVAAPAHSHWALPNNDAKSRCPDPPRP